MQRIARVAATVAAGVLMLVASGCGGDDGGGEADPLKQPTRAAPAGKVVVGSADFPENVLLAEIYAQAMEARGVQVERKLSIGAREAYYSQLESGGLTVLPEYNGALLSYVNKATGKTSTATTTEEVNAELKQVLPQSLTILDSAAAEDNDSLTVTKETADRYGLKSLADLAEQSKNFVVGGPGTFKDRFEKPLKDTYGIEFKQWRSFGTAGTVTVTRLKQGSIQAANLFTTDPAISTNGFVVLEDPERVFGVQNVTPLVNKAGIQAPAQQALNAVSAELDTPGLLDMMKKIAIDKDDPAAVAKDWLTQHGLV